MSTSGSVILAVSVLRCRVENRQKNKQTNTKRRCNVNPTHVTTIGVGNYTVYIEFN